MQINDMERALVNPLLLYNVLWGLRLPTENMRVINAQYGPFMALYDALCNYPEFDNDIENFISTTFKVDNELFPSDILDDPFNGPKRMSDYFVMFVNQYEELIMELQTKILLKRLDNEDLQFVKEDMPKFFLDLAYNPEDMAREVINAMETLSVLFPMSMEITTDICKFIRKSELHVIDVLYHPDHYMDIESHDRQSIILSTDTNGRTNMKYKKDKIIFDVPRLKKGDVMLPEVSDDELVGDEIFMDDDINKHVDALDISQGVDVCYPRNIIDTSDEFNEQIQVYMYILNKLISALNNYDGNKYAKDEGLFGIYVKRMKINKKFKKLSVLFDGQSYHVSNIMFKSRFITYIGSWLSSNLETIANKCYKLNSDSYYAKYEMKMEYVDTAVIHFLDFVNKILKDEPYGTDLMYLNELMTYMESPYKKSKLKHVLRKAKNIDEQTMILSDRVRPLFKHQQDISMDTLLKLSYLVATNATDSTNIVGFQGGYRFGKNAISKGMIEELGYAIIRSCKKKHVNPLFRFFMKSNPCINTRYTGLSESMAVGIAAIYYYAFMCNDKYISKIVSKIL